MFELKTTTECELTQFTGRTQKSGRDDVPAVSFRVFPSSARSASARLATWMDLGCTMVGEQPARGSAC